MAYYCWKCRNEIVFEVKHGVKVGRADTCPHCHSDLHSCKNCQSHDPGVHNQCREPESPFIRGREDGNFCHLFDMKNQSEQPQADDAQAKARAKLDAIFKK